MSPHRPPRYEMHADAQVMTITVGSHVFTEPQVTRRAEWDFEFKEAIAGSVSDDCYSGGVRDLKKVHKFYAEMLGPRFNYRFFAANYWLWIGNRMTLRTSNMLRFEGKHWRIYNPKLVTLANKVLPYLNEAERDGLFNLIPVIITHGSSPQEIRAKIGRGAWRRVANNAVSRNLLIMNAVLRFSEAARDYAFVRLLEMPSGVIRGIEREIGDTETIAARITPRKRFEEFRQTLHLVRDTQRMLLPAEFNTQWGYVRMQHEHEVATRALMQNRYSNKAFAEPWSYRDVDFSAVLLISQADIATEGATQHHCVVSYARSAAMLEYAVFRIEGKERATVGIKDGVVDQVYGSCNAQVSNECTSFARDVAIAYANRILAPKKEAA